MYMLLLNANGTVKAGQKISSTTGGLVGPLDNGAFFGILQVFWNPVITYNAAIRAANGLRDAAIPYSAAISAMARRPMSAAGVHWRSPRCLLGAGAFMDDIAC